MAKHSNTNKIVVTTKNKRKKIDVIKLFVILNFLLLVGLYLLQLKIL